MFIRFRKLILTHSKPADLKKWLEGREKKTGKALPSILGYPIYVPFKIGEKDPLVKAPFLNILEDISLSYWRDGKRWGDLDLIILFDHTGEICKHIEEVRRFPPHLFLRDLNFRCKKSTIS